MFHSSVQHTFAPAVAVIDSTPVVEQPAAALTPRVIRRLFDDAGPKLSQRDLDAALHDYQQCGRAPNLDTLSTARCAMEDLKEALTETDSVNGTDVTRRLFLQAARALLVDDEKRAAPQLLLSHLERTITHYLRCDAGLRMDYTPRLYVALTRYLNLLNERHLQAPADDHTRIGERHEHIRTLLFEPQRQHIVREFSRRAAQQDRPQFDLHAHLGISAGYRASDQDREDFRALFESGRILRHSMRYSDPAECRKLYRQYENEVGQAMAHDGVDGSNLHDLIAVRTYTVSSNELNKALREQNLAVIDTFAPYIKTFVSGHLQLHLSSARLRPDKDGFITLMRAVQLSEQAVFRAGYVVGAIFRQPAPMSCSDDQRASFWSLRNKYNVHIHVRCKTARRAGDISRHAHSEAESILALQTWFKVTHATWLHGGTPAYPWLDLVFEEISGPPPAMHSNV